jgi:dethiobiotin synthetase
VRSPRHLVVFLGTATDVGKTWCACRVIDAARGAGMRVAARKPVQSFDIADDPQLHDAELLAAATGEPADDVSPAHRSYPLAMAPPMAADALGREPIAIGDLLAEIRWPLDVHLGIVEAVGGVRSPLGHDGDSAELARRLQPDLVVVVADAGLGTINAVRLAVDALGPLPTVVVLNRYDHDDDLHRRNREWLVDVDRLDVLTDVAAILDRFS